MKTLYKILLLCVLFVTLPALAQTSLKTLISTNGVLVYDLTLEEYSLGPRTGPARVYALPPSANPWMGGTFLDAVDFPPLAAALRIDVGSICGSNVALAGGSTGGWLFGPYKPTKPSEAIADIRDYIPGAPNGTQVFVVVVGTVLPDGNWAERHPCGGGMNLVEFGVQLAFIYPTSTRLNSGKYQVGDFYYVTEIGENWYRILGNAPFGSSGSSATASPEPRLTSRRSMRDRSADGERTNGLTELLDRLR